LFCGTGVESQYGRKIIVNVYDSPARRKKRDFRSRYGHSVWKLIMAAAIVLLGCIAAYPTTASASVDELTVSTNSRANILLELVDPCLGSHWQLFPDPLHRGGPGRLVMVTSNEAGNTGATNSGATTNTVPHGPVDSTQVRKPQTFATLSIAPQKPPAAIVIRTGDHITVEQDSESVHASFRAEALSSAAIDQSLRVRLISPVQDPESSPTRLVISVKAVGAGIARWPVNNSMAYQEGARR
jgi:hypothetical protein